MHTNSDTKKTILILSKHTHSISLSLSKQTHNQKSENVINSMKPPSNSLQIWTLNKTPYFSVCPDINSEIGGFNILYSSVD